MSTTRAVPPEFSDSVPRDLQERLRGLRARYGRHRADSAGYRFEVATNRRRFQLAEIRKQIAELEERARVIESELEGFGKGMLVLVREEIAAYESEFPEAWSPTGVPGFRIWVLDEGRLVGARRPWTDPEFEARCNAFPDSDEIPHTDERCGRLGCGVYATRDLRPLLDSHVRESDRGYAAGRVEMSGKVVEHEDGYRAQRATVVSIALIGRNRQVCSSEPQVIRAVFRDPDAALRGAHSTALRTPVLPTIERHLEKGMNQWT